MIIICVCPLLQVAVRRGNGLGIVAFGSNPRMCVTSSSAPEGPVIIKCTPLLGDY